MDGLFFLTPCRRLASSIAMPLAYDGLVVPVVPLPLFVSFISVCVAN